MFSEVQFEKPLHFWDFPKNPILFGFAYQIFGQPAFGIRVCKCVCCYFFLHLWDTRNLVAGKFVFICFLSGNSVIYNVGGVMV